MQVDAFTDRPFAGNPAAICFLDGERDADWMLDVAAEMNLAETAFLVRRSDGYGLRWFTPTTEVVLCGHATLASAHAIWEEGESGEVLVFHTLSGELSAAREGEWIRLDFPVKRPREAELPHALGAALRVDAVAHAVSEDYHLIEVASEDAVRALQPDFRALGEVGRVAVMVTARAGSDRDYDFVSRFFAPSFGIDEDPVTGSAHCVLAPYWSERLGRSELTAYQASARGGSLRLRLNDDRVHLLGQAVTTVRGQLVV